MNYGIPQSSYAGQGQKNILFVSDFGDNISDRDLDQFFEKFKPSILFIQLNKGSFHKHSTPSANVIFKDHNSAIQAINALNLTKFRGRTIRIMFFEKENSTRYSNQNNLFIKNIPTNVTPREFYEFFLKFGDIVSAKLNEDDEGNNLGYGYIQYANGDSVSKAIEETKGKNHIFGRELEIEKFLRKNERMNSVVPMNENRSVYVKNAREGSKLPDETQLRELFKKYGNIVFFKTFKDDSKRDFAIISYDNEEAANKAKAELNNFKVKESELFVDNLMKKKARGKSFCQIRSLIRIIL